MEKVISLLFDIEKKANQIIERANVEKNELYEENEKAILEMEAAIADENNAKINAILNSAEMELEQEKDQLIENNNRQLIELETKYLHNHDEVVDKVFQRIIKAGM